MNFENLFIILYKMLKFLYDILFKIVKKLIL